MILTGEEDEDEEERALREYRERVAALLPSEGVNFVTVAAGQEELDAGFDAFMDEEYDDYKIGELDEEDVQAEDRIEKKVLEDAVDEFIEGTKKRFTSLAKEFGNEETLKQLIPDTKVSEMIYEEDLKDGDEPEEVK